MLPGTYSIMALQRIAIEIVDDVDAVPSGTSHTFPSAQFGPEFVGRVLVACISLRGAGAAALNQASCTIGGVTAIGGDDGEFLAAGPAMGAGIWAASVPAGLSGDVVVNWNGQSATNARLVLLSVEGISATPYDEQQPPGGGNGGTSRSDTINIPPNGVLIAAAAHTNTNETALAGVTERNEASVGSGRFAVGYDTYMPTETGRTVTASWTSTAARALRLASFRPA